MVPLKSLSQNGAAFSKSVILVSFRGQDKSNPTCANPDFGIGSQKANGYFRKMYILCRKW